MPVSCLRIAHVTAVSVAGRVDDDDQRGVIVELDDDADAFRREMRKMPTGLAERLGSPAKKSVPDPERQKTGFFGGILDAFIGAPGEEATADRSRSQGQMHAKEKRLWRLSH